MAQRGRTAPAPWAARGGCQPGPALPQPGRWSPLLPPGLTEEGSVKSGGVQGTGSSWSTSLLADVQPMEPAARVEGRHEMRPKVPPSLVSRRSDTRTPPGRVHCEGHPAALRRCARRGAQPGAKRRKGTWHEEAEGAAALRRGRRDASHPGDGQRQCGCKRVPYGWRHECRSPAGVAMRALHDARFAPHLFRRWAPDPGQGSAESHEAHVLLLDCLDRL